MELMNQSKQLLAFARDGDFAHPGEIEAIQLAMDPIPKNKSQRLLDVGCGLGGTADYLQRHGWGEVEGIDLDNELIQYAKSHYSNVSFIQGDILQPDRYLPKTFQVIYCFSAFFSFKSQLDALLQLSQVAADDCELMIFDYSRPSATQLANPFPWAKPSSRFQPIYLPELKEQLLQSGWHFKTHIDVSHQFETWYTQLLLRFEMKRDEIIGQFDEFIFEQMVAGYKELLLSINEKKIGGIIVYAHR